jgi:hypothetical protein
MKEHLREQIEHRGFNINIYYDQDPLDPRKDWDPAGHMICFHSRYDLGDNHNYDENSFLQEIAENVCPKLSSLINCWEDGLGWEKYGDPDKSDVVIKNAVSKVLDHFVIMLPLNLYDHSGITMRTSPFSDPWDSGLVGIIYMTKKEAQEEFPGDPDYIEKATRLLEGEVQTYDQYLTGEVYGYDIEPTERNKAITCNDSCWGYFGDESLPYMIAEAKSAIAYAIEKYREQVRVDHLEKLQTTRFLQTCWAD